MGKVCDLSYDYGKDWFLVMRNVMEGYLVSYGINTKAILLVFAHKKKSTRPQLRPGWRQVAVQFSTHSWTCVFTTFYRIFILYVLHF